jgi:hypothetical protein
LLVFFWFSEIPGGFGHLALTEFCQPYLINGSTPAPWTNNWLFEIRTLGLFVDPNLADIAIKFLSALLALKVNCHSYSLILVACRSDEGIHNAGYCPTKKSCAEQHRAKDAGGG